MPYSKSSFTSAEQRNIRNIFFIIFKNDEEFGDNFIVSLKLFTIFVDLLLSAAHVLLWFFFCAFLAAVLLGHA